VKNTQRATVHQAAVSAVTNHNLQGPACAPTSPKQVPESLTNTMKPGRGNTGEKVLAIHLNSQGGDNLMLNLAWVQ